MSSATKEDKIENDIDELDDGYDTEPDDDPTVFRVRDPLKEPTAKIFSTQELHNLIHEGLIDLNPSYQRDVVWPESKQIGLIDSIFRNFYIPPIVFAVQRDEEEEEVRVCVDGKQRLTSIQKFFDGQIPHRDVKTKKNYWFTRSDAQKGVRLDIPDHWKQQFSSKSITCVEYFGLAPGTEREIFQRVQLGMTLTVAEKLQAIASPWAEWISALEAQHVAVEGGLSQVLEWDTKRGRDFQCLAHFVYCCDGLPDEQLPTAQKMEKWLSRVDSPGQQFKDDIESVLREFWNISTNKDLNEGFRKIGKRLAPVEFVFIGVLLYVLRKGTPEDRARAIYNLRRNIRGQFVDIRNNTNVGKAMWGFISDLKADPSGSRPNDLSHHHQENGKGKRRRKAGHDDESDGEYRPSPVKHLGKTPKTRSKQPRMG